MGLPYYISDMIKAMRQESEALAAELAMRGHQATVTSVVTSKECDILQT